MDPQTVIKIYYTSLNMFLKLALSVNMAVSLWCPVHDFYNAEVMH